MLTPFQRTKPQAIPSPGGENAQEAASVYDTFYGQMPIPATAFATSTTALASVDPPSVLAPQWESSVVQRANRRDGIVSTGGRQLVQQPPPELQERVRSSEFQEWLYGPQINYVLNRYWYIAYPAATVMNGGKRNQALSTRVDQLPTRTTGGPTAAQMTSAPRFSAVQQVPRFSTMPPSYPITPTST